MIYSEAHNAAFVPHLITGNTANAESWNLLYGEMDKRVNSITNGKSILFLNTREVDENNYYEGGYTSDYWEMFRGKDSAKVNDNPDSERGVIGDRQFYFTSGAVTGDDGEYPYTTPECKRCDNNLWSTFGYASEVECQEINCNFSLTDRAGWYWKLWGKYFLEDQTHVNWLYKHKYFDETVSGSYVIDVSEERNLAVVVEATGYYTRRRGRETPVFEVVTNRGSTATRFDGSGLFEFNSQATCPQSPFLYCQNLDNSLAVHVLSDDHPAELISINCIPSGSASGLSGVSPSTGFGGAVSGSGVCPKCDGVEWMLDPFGFYSQAECEMYYSCDVSGVSGAIGTGYADVCPSGVTPESLSLSGKRIISYGNWNYSSYIGWTEDKIFDIGSDEKIIPTDEEYILHNNLNSENRTSQTELIFDGYKSEYENFTFPAKYNKYKFFRIHNLNPYDMNFVFEPEPGLPSDASGLGQDGLFGNAGLDGDVYAVSECSAGTGLSFTIKAGESRCVRRDFGTYTTGFNHFQKFMRGDAKYSFQLGLMGSTTAAYPTYSNPYVKSEESNWRDYTNNVNNPFILGRYFQIFQLENRVVLDETWPKTWDGYHTYVDTKNEEAPPVHLTYTGYLPWSYLRQPKQYDFKDFNPYDPKTLLADLIYTTGYALRSISIKSGEVDTNPYAGTSAGFADTSLFSIDPTVDQVEHAVNVSLIPYSGAKHLEQFLHQLGVNLFPHDPNVDFVTPRSFYGQQVAMFGHGWSGMFAGPRRMLAGEDEWYEPRKMVAGVCVADSPGADIGLRDLLDEEQKARGVSPVEKEYEFLNSEGVAAGIPSLLTGTKGSQLTGFYGWKLGYSGTWERYSKEEIVSGKYTAGYEVGVTGSGVAEYLYLSGDKNNNPDNISCVSGMRQKLFANWFTGDASNTGWFNRTAINLDPPDPFAYQIQAMPVSTNLFGRDNAFNNIMQLYPLARLRLDPLCLCHEQHVVPMIDTIFGHNINIGDYYYQVTPKLQTRRGDTTELPFNDHVIVGEDERKARHTFKESEYYDVIDAGWFNHYKYLHPSSGPKGGAGGVGSTALSKCHPYYSEMGGADIGYGGEQPVFSGTRYNKRAHVELWDPGADNASEADNPHCPVFVDLAQPLAVHQVSASDSHDTANVYVSVTGRPLDLIEVTPYYQPVFYADPVPFRLFHGTGPTSSRWVGVENWGSETTPLRRRTLHELEIIKRCHKCEPHYTEGNCACGDTDANIAEYHVLPDIFGGPTDFSYVDYAGFGALSTYAKSTYTTVHMDYMDETHRSRTFKAMDNAIMPIQFKKFRDLPFDYHPVDNADQLTDGPENHRSFFSTTIYDFQEVFGEFNKIEGQWTGYRAMTDTPERRIGKWTWSHSSSVPKSTKAVDYDPIMRLTRPGPHYGDLMDQINVGSGSPTGETEEYGFDFSRDVSGENFNNNLRAFMDPDVVAMSEGDPFKYDETNGGIGYANIRFADGASIKYDFQKNVNLYALNREPIYSFGDPSRGNAFSEGMQVDPDVDGYPNGTPILRSRYAFGLDKYNEMSCNRSAVIAGRDDNSYFTRGATNTLDGGYLSIGFRNGLSTFYQSNRTPEYYSAMVPASENRYNSGVFGQNLLAESGYKYLHPDVFSSEHIKEIRHGKVKNKPIGGWNNENLFQKKVFGFPRFFQWMDNYSTQVDAKGDYLDLPTNYGTDVLLSQFGPPMGIYVLRQSCDELEYGSGCNGFDLKRVGEDESGNAINEEYRGITSLPEGDGYWIECTGYYNQMMSGDLNSGVGAPTQEDHDNFSSHCPSIKITDWLLRTGDPFFFQKNPFCDGSSTLDESWAKAYPYMETGVSGVGVIKGGIVVGTGVWYMFPPKVDLIQPLSGAPSNSFTPSWSSIPVATDANNTSGKGANVYPYFSGYPNVPWVESLCISGIVTETSADGVTYNQTSNLYLDYFINNKFGVRRMDKYPCYGDSMPTCPHDVLVEL